MHTKSKETILTSTALNIYLLVLSTQLDGEISCITSSKCQKVVVYGKSTNIVETEWLR